MNRPASSREARNGLPAPHLWGLCATLLAAFVLRILLLGDQNVWWDEGLAIWAVRQSWARVTLWTAADVHPPIYFWLLKSWVALAGESEFAARFISLVCGMLTVAITYPLGKALFGKRAALLGLSLLAFSRFHVWWSQEMRMYIVATLWTALSLYALVRWWRAEGWISTEGQASGRRNWEMAGYILATAGGLYTLYLFITVILIENLFFLYTVVRLSTAQRKRAFVRWTLSQLAVLLIFVPWLVLALREMRSWSVAAPFDLGLFLRLYATLLTLGISTYIDRYTLLVTPFFVIIAAALLMRWLSRRRVRVTTRGSIMLLLLFMVIPEAVVYALTQPRNIFYAPRVEARYLVMSAPAFCLLLAWSLMHLLRRNRWLGLGALAFVVGAFLWTLPGHYTGRYLRDEHQTMARIISAYAQPGDAVLLVSGNRLPVFDYYYGRLPQGAARPPLIALPQHHMDINGNNVERELAPLTAQYSRLWLAEVNAPMQDEEGLVKQWLDARYEKPLSHAFAHNALTLYAPDAGSPVASPTNLKPQHPLDLSLRPGVTVLGYDLPTTEFRPGDVIRAGVYYSTTTGSLVIVQIVDAEDRVLDQHMTQWQANTGFGRQEVEFPVYEHTPGGIYRLRVVDVLSSQWSPASFGSLRITNTGKLRTGTPLREMRARLGDSIDLLGYALLDSDGRVVEELQPGQSLSLDLYWRTESKLDHNYTVFVHLLGSAFNPATAGPVWAGHDSQPLDGGYPTRQWFAGDTIIDRHELTLDPGCPPGEYELEVGMYLLETMERLPAVDGQGQAPGDRIVLGRFPVRVP